MKQMWQPVRIMSIKENNGKTILQIATDASREDILRYTSTEGIGAELKFDDGRRITAEQRRKLYATFKDISDYTGDAPEYIKELFKFMYCAESGQEYFSLSDCSLETARELINSVIEFVIIHDIPLTELAVDRTDDIDKYLFFSIKYSRCCICGIPGLVYTLDKHHNKMCLCNTHYDIAKAKGLIEFQKAFKVYGIQFKNRK